MVNSSMNTSPNSKNSWHTLAMAAGTGPSSTRARTMAWETFSSVSALIASMRSERSGK